MGKEWVTVTNHDRVYEERAFDGIQDFGINIFDPKDNTPCYQKSGLFSLLLALSISEELLGSLT